MSRPTFPIKGIPVPAGQPIPTRKEITAWISDYPLQVSLFMRALTEFQQLSPTQNPLSYYRIAGIHGDPDVSWDGVGNPQGGGFSGYFCAHNRFTFATWHRPYLALFEQRIYEIMLEIIARSDPAAVDRTVWEDAARNWRLPYWDWGVKQSYIEDYGLPEIFTKERIPILNFDQTTTTNIVNPLWKFSNPTGVPMGHRSMGVFRLRGHPWDRAVGTSRFGIVTSQNEAIWRSGINDWQEANEAFQNPSQIGWFPSSTGDAVYRLFAPGYFSSWESFESTMLHDPESPTDYLSLEYVHNGIHPLSGGWDESGKGLGHMADPSVSAFDPIFWFHHCNVDRLAAIFQTLNPNMWFNPQERNGRAPLDPFHTDNMSTSWTSDLCRDWGTSLGYHYDDLLAPPPPTDTVADSPDDSQPGSQSALVADSPQPGSQSAPVADSPDDPQPGSQSAPVADPPNDSKPGSQSNLSRLRKMINEKYGHVRKELDNSPSIKGRKNDYIINVIYDRYALYGAPYFIHFFLGAPPGGVSFFTHADSYIGSVYTFSSSLEESGNTVQCRNCLEQKKNKVLSTAQIPITNVILGCAKDASRPELGSMDPDEVESYLEKNLSWRAVSAVEDGDDPLSSSLIVMERLPRTKIFTLKGSVHLPDPDDDSELLTYSNYTPMWRATAGKPGGAREGDQ